jgi:hypothetical protein
MRTNVFAAIPLVLVLAVAPARAQVSVGVHIDIPVIGHGGGGDYRRSPGRDVYVNAYPPVPYGQWKKHYRQWHRTTLYAVGNRYYAYPVRRGRAVIVYRDRDQYFWGPSDGNWKQWDRWDRGDRYGRGDQYGRDGRNDRDDRSAQYGRDDRNGNSRDARSNGRGQQRGSASERYALR